MFLLLEFILKVFFFILTFFLDFGNILERIYSFLINIQPGLLQNAALAFITILIPLAIAIISEYLMIKERPNADYWDLDFNLIIEKVLNFKKFIIFNILIFGSTVIWNSKLSYLNILLFFLYLCSQYKVIQIIFNVYKWLTADKFSFRFEYLKSLKRSDTLIKAWNSVWRVQKMEINNERIFIDNYFLTIEELLTNKENFSTISDLLDTFSNNIQHRSTNPTIYKTFLPIIFKVHCQARIYRKDDESMQNNNNMIIDTNILSKSEDILSSMQEKFVFIGKTLPYYFNPMNEHLKAKNDEYLNYFIEIFLNCFIKNSKKYSEVLNIIRQKIPSNWRITIENLKGPNKKIPYLLEKYLMVKISDYLFSTHGSVNQSENQIVFHSVKIFYPEVNPAWYLCMLLFNSCSNNKVKMLFDLCDQRIFEIISTMSTEGESPERTVMFYLEIFPNDLTEKNISEYINNLDDAKFKDKPHYEYIKEIYSALFIAILESIKNKTATSLSIENIEPVK